MLIDRGNCEDKFVAWMNEIVVFVCKNNTIINHFAEVVWFHWLHRARKWWCFVDWEHPEEFLVFLVLEIYIKEMILSPLIECELEVNCLVWREWILFNGITVCRFVNFALVHVAESSFTTFTETVVAYTVTLTRVWALRFVCRFRNVIAISVYEVVKLAANHECVWNVIVVEKVLVKKEYAVLLVFFGANLNKLYFVEVVVRGELMRTPVTDA